MEIVFATNNLHKLGEISAMLSQRFKIVGLNELDIAEEIPEDHDTLEENASQKAWYIYEKVGRSCFADDTGLEVDALGGAPGVYSARYSRIGSLVFPEMTPVEGNLKKLLLEMEGVKNRKARFRTVISLIMGGIEHRFEGICEGAISESVSGSEGFGYDPLFRPDGYTLSFAEMDPEEKNRISHRGKAVHALVQFLNEM
ncbi:MAG: RdgB/HAM1 family non-canonical purine NTP pyrophosphatase [Bacteroidetes bacterium]|nr:RdgB/HAM1 family non-canonical purine NTP pyrophosphatase [Bacteroidota bacterium]